MARKKFDLGVDESRSTPSPKNKKSLFHNPLEQTSLGRQKAAKVAGRNTDAAGRIRKTIFLDPITIDEIDRLAAEEGYGKMDFYEWLILMGLQQFDGGVRPTVEDNPVVKARIRIDR
ncbi:MAG: hypothetical protein KDE56_31065 [Anaerolineales bacterium]|nr:hypothetical protein [Anaerolineales bacterium]